MFWSPGQGCDWMFEFHLPSPAAAAWKQCSGAVISIIFRELQCYSWQHPGQWRHHTSHFSNTVILKRQFRIHEWCCCIFPIFVVICFFILYFVFSLIFRCLISPTPGTVKAGCVLSVVAMAGPGPISRHYALSAAPDTSKMGTFPSAPPLAPAKMWIQLLNTGIGISNEHQLGGGAIYQGLEHLWRAAEKWKSFSPHCQDHRQIIHSINLFQTLGQAILCSWCPSAETPDMVTLRSSDR